MAQMQNKHNRDQQYAVRLARGPQPLVVDSNTYKSDSVDYIDDICPYATFQLAKPTYSESSYSGNVYSGPYHSVRGSFVYHDVKPPPIDKFKLGHVSFITPFHSLISQVMIHCFPAIYIYLISHRYEYVGEINWFIGFSRVKNQNTRKWGEKAAVYGTHIRRVKVMDGKV